MKKRFGIFSAVVIATADDALDVPFVFVAVIVNEYAVFAVNPDNDMLVAR